VDNEQTSANFSSHDYVALSYFRAIASRGSLVGAAKDLHVGEAALSIQLKRLECALGNKLFERRNRRLFLNKMGHVAADYANAIFRLGDELAELLRSGALQGSPTLKVGVLDSIGDHFIVDLIEFIHRYTGGRVLVTQGTRTAMIEELRRHRVDVFLNDQAPLQQDGIGLFAKRIARLPVIICGEATSSGNLPRTFPKSLGGQRFIMPDAASALRPEIERFFKLHRIEVSVVAEI